MGEKSVFFTEKHRQLQWKLLTELDISFWTGAELSFIEAGMTGQQDQSQKARNPELQ